MKGDEYTHKKFIAIIMVVLLTVSTMGSELILSVDAIIPGEDTVGVEEKVVCKATIEDEFADNRILVVLNNSASLSLHTYETSDFPEILCQNVENLTETATALTAAKLNGIDPSTAYQVTEDTITFSHFFDIDLDSFHQVLCLQIANPGKENVLRAISKLQTRADVLYAGPDYVVTACTTEPNDIYRLYQWPISQIQLPEAWDLEVGNFVNVGVIDSGIDGDHPDLINRVNVGLSRDYSYGGNATLTSVVDRNGHGTHVAGIIAAQGNNSIGITGAGWNTRVVSLAVFDENLNGYASYVAKAINYATSYGIPILNFSGRYKDTWGSYDYALNTVIDNYPGLFVCAAGNESSDNDSSNVYPSNYRIDNLISVGSSNRDDGMSSFSNYGKTTVDIFAPGESIVSCYPVDKCLDGTHATYEAHNSIHIGDGYHYLSGTSMAAPYVAGVAALILSMHPSLSADEVKEWLMDGVDIVEDDEGNSVFGDYCVSGGRLNAYKAVNNHVYNSYSSLSAAKHNRVCECGAVLAEAHTWKTATRVEVGGGSTTVTYCSKCGYEK